MRTCKLSNYDIFLVDLDGVVWRGKEIIEKNVKILKKLINEGKKVIFLTNNSTRSRAVYAELLRDAGIETDEKSIVTSGYAAVMWVSERRPKSLTYVLGEEGLAEEAAKAGLRLATRSEALSGKVEVVLVGLDRNLTYSKLNAAFKAVSDGALFVASNRDPTLPLERGSKAPGAGAIVAALETCLQRKPDFVAGKPNTWMIEVALKNVGKKGESVVIGDRLDTDILMANIAGIDSILVLTGVATLEDLRRAGGRLKPTCYFNSLEDAI